MVIAYLGQIGRSRLYLWQSQLFVLEENWSRVDWRFWLTTNHRWTWFPHHWSLMSKWTREVNAVPGLWGPNACSHTRPRMMSHLNKDGNSTTWLCAAPQHLGHFDRPMIYPARAFGATQAFKCYLQGYLFGPVMTKKIYLFRDNKKITRRQLSRLERSAHRLGQSYLY